MEPCIKESTIGSLLESKKNFEEFMREIKDNHLKCIYEKIDAINEKMSSRRPTWMMLWIISFLTTLCGILLAILFRK